MNSLVALHMGAAGVLFGAWPILLRYSELHGTVAVLAATAISLVLLAVNTIRTGVVAPWVGIPVVAAVVLLIVVLLAEAGLPPIRDAYKEYLYLVAAGAAVGLGLIIFFTALSGLESGSIGTPFVFMLVVQLLVPAVFHAAQGGIDVRFTVGIAAALVALYALGPQAT